MFFEILRTIERTNHKSRQKYSSASHPVAPIPSSAPRLGLAIDLLGKAQHHHAVARGGQQIVTLFDRASQIGDCSRTRRRPPQASAPAARQQLVDNNQLFPQRQGKKNPPGLVNQDVRGMLYEVPRTSKATGDRLTKSNATKVIALPDDLR